jgi:hypothetical protein
MTQGKTFRQTFRYRRRETVDGPLEPVDLTTWTASAHWRRRWQDAAPAFAFDSRAVEKDGTIYLGADGTIELVATDEETLAATPMSGYWSLRLVDAAGEADVLLEGEAAIRPAITR